MSSDWDKGLVSDRTDNNLETCYCIGRQVVNDVLQPECPCIMRSKGYVLVKTHDGYRGSTCLWDNFSEEERKKPMMLSCPCPKCTPSY